MPYVRGLRASDGFIQIQEPIRFMKVIQPTQNNPWGDIFYVDGTSGSNDWGGKSPREAVKTITKALALAGNYDWIIIAPGSYEERAKLEVTQHYLKLIGSTVGGGDGAYGQCSIQVAVDYYGTDSFVGMDVEGNGVEICNINFTQWSGNPMIKIAPSAAALNVYGTHIHDCTFNCGMENSVVGIDMGTVSTDAPGVVVERCSFHEIAGAAARGVVLNGGASVVRDSFFWIGTAGIGIEDCRDFSTTSRPRRRILDNRFQTSDASGAYGISVTQTPTAGYLLVDGNHFVNFADNDHCISKRTGLTGVNYLGITLIAIT